MSNRQKATSVLVAFFYSLLFSSAAVYAEEPKDTPPAANVYTALADENQAPTREQLTEFDCTDKIFAVLEIDDYPYGEYQFSVRWIDPAGEQREHTQYPFWVRSKEQHRVWAWLLLSRARGAGMLTFINPAAGLEEFVGAWKIEVRLNDKLVANHKFDVIC